MLLIDKPIPKPLKEHLTDGRRLHYYDKGDNVPLVGEGIWQVCRGFVQLSQITVSGDEILLGWAVPSTFFGLWLTHLEVYQAKALSDIYLKWYSLSDIKNSPALSQMMLTQMAHRIRQTEALLAIAGLKRVEERLYHLLQLLKHELGQPINGGTRLSVRLTHQNLANAIGTTRVTVTKVLGEFQRQGWISLDSDRHLVIQG